MSPLLPLGGAILLEVAATTCLQASDGFSRPWPTAAALIGYGLAFWLLSHALKGIPVGVAYALWSGVGIVLIAVLGRTLFGQRLDPPALIGIALILAGVLCINLFSRATV